MELSRLSCRPYIAKNGTSFWGLMVSSLVKTSQVYILIAIYIYGTAVSNEDGWLYLAISVWLLHYVGLRNSSVSSTCWALYPYLYAQPFHIVFICTLQSLKCLSSLCFFYITSHWVLVLLLYFNLPSFALLSCLSQIALHLLHIISWYTASVELCVRCCSTLGNTVGKSLKMGEL